MKHLFTFLATLLFTVSFAQQKLIAIKGTTTDAIATTLEEAINIAQPNDKIYLPGGNYTLNDSLQKPVHIIGTGYNHLIPRATPITVFTSELKIGSQASGAVIEGLKLNTGVYVNANNCLLKKIHSSNAIKIFRNITNTNIINCFIYEVGCSDFYNQLFIQKLNSVYIYNSIIERFYWIENSTIRNSIVYNSYGIQNVNLINSIYGFDSANSFSNQGYINTNSLIPQIVNDCNTFISYFIYVSSCYPLLSLNYNYHLSPTAPIQNIGIYYGDYPWKDGGQPINPHILENNSFLDVQNEQFKLKVKVVPQTN